MTPEYLRSIFRYDTATGEIYWRERENVPGFWNARYAGKRAGAPNIDGYITIKINNVTHQAHRMIWLMETGQLPEFIDHINGDRMDNRIGNLRPATKAENNRNARIRSDNASGEKGVSWGVREKKWRARIRIDGKQKTIGYFTSKADAAAAYRDAAASAHKEFARAS